MQVAPAPHLAAGQAAHSHHHQRDLTPLDRMSTLPVPAASMQRLDLGNRSQRAALALRLPMPERSLPACARRGLPRAASAASAHGAQPMPEMQGDGNRARTRARPAPNPPLRCTLRCQSAGTRQASLPPQGQVQGSVASCRRPALVPSQTPRCKHGEIAWLSRSAARLTSPLGGQEPPDSPSQR